MCIRPTKSEAQEIIHETIPREKNLKSSLDTHSTWKEEAVLKTRAEANLKVSMATEGGFSVNSENILAMLFNHYSLTKGVPVATDKH